MNAIFCLSLVITPCAFGQFSTLAVSDDAQVIYFSTGLTLKGSNTSGTQVFRYTSTDLSPLAPAPDSVTGVDWSADRAVYSWWTQSITLYCPDVFHGPCTYLNTYSGTLTASNGTTHFNRAVAVSRNGRFAVLFGGTETSGFPTPPTRLDLTTGAQTGPSSGGIAAPHQAITSNGAVLLALPLANNQAQLSLWTPSGQRSIAIIPSVSARISDNGAWIAYANPSDNTLHSIAVANGIDRVIASAAGTITNFSLSNAGDLVSFLAPSSDGLLQLYLARTDGSGAPLIGVAPVGFSDAAIAGDGSAVIAATSDGRLWRVDSTGLVTRELISAPPLIQNLLYEVVPGSWYRLTGTNLNSSLTLGSMPLHILSASSTQVVVQVPFDAPLGPTTIMAMSDSPFQQALPVRIALASPQLLTLADAGLSSESISPIIAIHEDFRSLVTQSNPARPGEVVSFYLSGLGPVTPPVPNGSPAPADPPAVVTRALTVSMQGQIPQVLFAGLAPGLIGIYQLSVRLSATIDTTMEPTEPAPILYQIYVSEDGADTGSGGTFWLDIPGGFH